MITIRDGMLPLMDFGDAPENPDQPFFTFPTTLAHDGAAHIINPAIFLGSLIDGEPDGQPTPQATGDDAILVFPLSIDDEDGVVLPPSVSAGSTVAISITASVAGYLDGWLDFDMDGNWLNPADHVLTMEPMNPGSNVLTFEVPANAIPGISCFRFRFRDYALPLSFDGMAGNGEVEDYSITIAENVTTGYDFGDAPDDPFPSLLASDGARHLVDWVTFLGLGIDVEPDGNQSSVAQGDDFNN
jgi:hypothetical protein